MNSILNSPVFRASNLSSSSNSILSRAKTALEKAAEVKISVDDIRPFPGQPRTYFRETGLQQLSTAIELGGQTTPGIIRLNPGRTRYELVDGERRWRAIRMIEVDRRPLFKASLIEADDDVVQFLIAGAANFNREGHTPLEIVDTIDRMKNFGLTMSEISGVLGISEAWAGQMHGLKNLDSAVMALLDPERPKAQRLPVSAAVQISKIDRELQWEIAQRILNRTVSLGTLRKEVLKVAKRAGVEVRVREVDVRKRCESVRNKMKGASQALSDVCDALTDPKLHEALLDNESGHNEALRRHISRLVLDLEKIATKLMK